MSTNAKTPLWKWPWKIVSWPVRAPLRRFGPVKGAMVFAGGFCGVLLLWNLVLAPTLMGFMFAHMPRPVVPVTVAEVKTVSWMPGLEAVGTSKAFQGADMAAEADGVIAAINVTAQSRVTAGQSLIQVDDAVEQADLIAALANVRLQETALARTSALTKKGVSAQAQLDDARNQLDVARSQLARLQALIDQKSVKARFDGVAGIPRVDVGQYVTKGTVLITLQDLDRVYVDFTIPEQSAGQLALDQTVRFGATRERLDYRGKIIGIDPKVDPQTRLVSVRAEIADAKGRILPGQFLQLRVDLPVEANVMALPATAVVPSLYGDYVYVVQAPEGDKDAKTRVVAQQIIKTGRRNGALVEIRDGLKPGQLVVASGQNAMQNGASVNVVSTVDPGKLADNGAPR